MKDRYWFTVGADTIVIKKADYIGLLLIFSVSAVLGYIHFLKVDLPNGEARFELHNEIIKGKEGKALSPDRYRVLIPFMVEIIRRGCFLDTLFSKNKAFLLSYAMYDLLAIFFTLAMLFVWLRTWFSNERALIGVLFVASTIPIALKDDYFQPWSLMEPGLFAAALLLIYKRRLGLLALLTLLASLNRETAVFIPFAFLFANLDVVNIFCGRKKIQWKAVFYFVAIFSEWAVIFLGLRYFLGIAPYVLTIGKIISLNLTRSRLFYTVINGGLFLGGFWILTVLGFRHAPSFIKRVTFLVPFYLATVMIWGLWNEVRLLMPLYPILIPLGLCSIYKCKMVED